MIEFSLIMSSCHPFSEPKYVDPLMGAPPSFNTRVAEIASLESETLRWERSKKSKKKNKEKDKE